MRSMSERLYLKQKELGHSVAADCRRPLYWNLFSGACGHTYGHHSVWQMFAAGRKPVNGPLMTWDVALGQPGAAQMQHGRRLIESRPILTRVPDDSVVVPDEVTTASPGAGARRFAATRRNARARDSSRGPLPQHQHQRPQGRWLLLLRLGIDRSGSALRAFSPARRRDKTRPD